MIPCPVTNEDKLREKEREKGREMERDRKRLIYLFLTL